MSRPRRPRPSPDHADRRAIGFCLGIVGTVVILAIIGAFRSTGTRVGPTSSWHLAMSPTMARSTLASLTSVSFAREVAYDRTTDFGPAWQDVDHNGCDTRNDVLHRDLTEIRTRPGTDGCVVTAGALDDPYTGSRLTFRKSHADAVQIDHLVPLHAAWMLGAWRWSPERRLQYANDPLVLVAVDGPSNLDKGDRLADRWRPPNRGSWCAYGVNSVAIHAAYGLGVTVGERSALEHMITKCAK